MTRHIRHVGVFALTLLIIEFLDEFVFGAREAAWPLIRTDLNLDYVQIGLLLSVPIIPIKFVLLGLMGLFNAGWYSILKARLYSAMPGQMTN